jgi:hypothetical protein
MPKTAVLHFYDVTETMPAPPSAPPNSVICGVVVVIMVACLGFFA